ncbi:MAG: dihydrolipoamide acetyltransferase family protein [Candidatus Palauibacterales bacterium]|nr:dihydrolipoamide acetyltransferase family protein [Candidatus Palauibacterales bacterium]
MSKVDVIMPQMGESIAEGTLTKWLKQPGDEVERDEDLFEISTDKVDADIPAPESGVLDEILVEEGETVEVDTVVARIETEAGAAEAEEPEPSDGEEEETAEEPEAAEEPAGAAEEEGDAAETETAAGEEEPEVLSREERLQTRSTPLVRKIAAEHDVDIAEVEGSGIAGRVTRDDIMAYIEEREEAPAREPAAEEERPAAEPVEPGKMRVPIHGATLDIDLPDVPIREGDEVEEMSRGRIRTMEHMLMSKRVSAHVTTVTEIDFERVVRLRKKLKPEFAERGVKLTYGPFIMKAVVEALKEYPRLNASVDGTRIVKHRDINLGIAVAINDGQDLVVPVLKNADRLSLMGLAQEANELAEKARNRDLDFDDIQGGTFTITNVGVFGNLFGTPIINQPQVAILGTGVIEKRPIVTQDDMGNDTVSIRHMSYFGMSYDHRIVDGALAAFFLNKVTDVLENFPEDAI